MPRWRRSRRFRCPERRDERRAALARLSTLLLLVGPVVALLRGLFLLLDLSEQVADALTFLILSAISAQAPVAAPLDRALDRLDLIAARLEGVAGKRGNAK